jgi:methyl-accepting chemotaxis protein
MVSQDASANVAASTDGGLAGRLSFMNLDNARCESIRSIKPIVDRELTIALDRFYETVRKTPETRKFFNNDAHMSAAKGAQMGHWASISNAKFDGHYVSNFRKVGHAHARTGLEPRWYIGGYAIVAEHLIEAIIAEMWPKGFSLARQKNSAKDVGQCIGALVKAIFLDMDHLDVRRGC